MPMHTVTVTFHRAGDSSPTNRHYPIHAETPEEALRIVKNMKPYFLPFTPGVKYGHPRGSKFKVTGTAPF